MTSSELDQVLMRLDNMREDNREFRAETRSEVTALRLDIKTLSDRLHASETALSNDLSNLKGRLYTGAAVIAAAISLAAQYFFR